jgi:predicted ester cyclase
MAARTLTLGQIVWTGTNTGPFMGQPPTGKAVTLRAVAVLETAGGKITRVRHYLDIAGMMARHCHVIDPAIGS